MPYSIGKIAKLTNTSISTLRYYEKLGLLGKIPRSYGKFRQYSEQVIGRIRFIKNAKLVGFNLNEIHTLLALQATHAPSLEVKNRTQKKLQVIHTKIATLKKMHDILFQWEQACDGKLPIDSCPILTHLYQYQHPGDEVTSLDDA